MKCPNCQSNISFIDLIRINHKNPYECPVCFRKSKFNHSHGFMNLIAGLAGLAGVIFFFSIQKFGWLYGFVTVVLLLLIFIFIFLKYAKLEIIEENN